jgi:hypothetical protein
MEDKSYAEGRDEMNLADFPISVLQRQQPTDDRGAKKDTAVYTSSRYDPKSRQRLEQRVVLESSSRHGLPTPADENVVLALLFIAKHTHNFSSPRVHFSPRQMFRIMGWAPNSRSYDRLRAVLRRLQALVIRYENSWWDIEGREYEAEVATGIISEYELARQVGGRKGGAAVPPSYVHWSPQFYQSLSKGNLKRLDLEVLFSLKLPTSQRMYRFLDKRFYQTATVEMDLFDFACGHIGLSRVENVAELKRRLSPAVAELEAIAFIESAKPAERYQKVKAGVWRVRFRKGKPALPAPAAPVEILPAVVPESPLAVVIGPPERALALEFYRLWDGRRGWEPGDGDLKQGRAFLEQFGEAAEDVLPYLVQVLRRAWPECKSFSGAVDKYLTEAGQEFDRARRREASELQAKVRLQRGREEAARRAAEQERLRAQWEALPTEQRDEVRREVLRRYPDLKDRPAILEALCLGQIDPASRGGLF